MSLRDEFPEKLYVVKGKDGESVYYDATEQLEDWKPEYVDNTPVAIYELRTVGKMVTSRHFVLPPGEER